MLTKNQETTTIVCRFELSKDQILTLILNELGTNSKLDLTELTSKAKLHDFCKFKISQCGERVYKVLSSNQLLIMKQDVLSQLKGVV